MKNVNVYDCIQVGLTEFRKYNYPLLNLLQHETFKRIEQMYDEGASPVLFQDKPMPSRVSKF